MEQSIKYGIWYCGSYESWCTGLGGTRKEYININEAYNELIRNWVGTNGYHQDKYFIKEIIE